MDELGQIGGSPLEGRSSQGEFGNASVKSRIVADQQTLKEFQKTLKELGDTADDLEKKFDKLFKKTKDLNVELKDAIGGKGKGKGSYISKGDMPEATKLTRFVTRLVGGGGGDGGDGGDGGGDGGGGYAAMFRGISGVGGGRAGAVAKFAANAYNVAVPAMDARTDRNLPYALGADRLGLVYQQTMGISGEQYRSQYRRPLTQYRLGAEGMNPLLALQAQTGLNAQMLAPSAEALRTVTGFGYSSQDMANMFRSMAGPETANRMFMTMGTGIYGIGGQQRSPMQVFQDITRRLGLTDEETLKGGMQQGSNVRQRLAMSGLDEQAQTMLLQYAQSNVQYRKKGGKGMYDPSKKGQRELMGIEDTYASQQEETTRVKAEREEKMYSRQADNYADMEKRLQSVNKLLGEFEDRLSAIIGQRASFRPFMDFGKNIVGTVGRLFGIGDGMESGISSVGNSAAAYSKMTLAGSMSAFSKSGVSSFAGTSAEKTETYNNTSLSNYSVSSVGAPLSNATQSRMIGLNSTFKERLGRMLRDRPTLGLGSLIRSYDEQKAMFLSRYNRTTKETKIEWDGSFWEKKNDGQLPAAPPGRSYHERGLAADLTGTPEDYAWMHQNAERYGLKAYGASDPPHVELQKSLIPADQLIDFSKSSSGAVGNTRETNKTSANQASGGKNRKFVTRTHPIHGQYSVPAPPWSDADWDAVAWAETHRTWNHKGDKNVSGGLGISDDVWKRFGGKAFAPRAWQAGRKEQILVANRASWTGYTTKDGTRIEPVGVGGFTTISRQKGKNITWPSGDGNAAMPSLSRPTPQKADGSGAVYNINVSPNINISSTGSPATDIRQMAREVAVLLDKEIRLTLMRSV